MLKCYKVHYIASHYMADRRCRSPAPAIRQPPTVPRIRCSTFGCCSFVSAGPTVWNSLPNNLRNPAVGPDQFRNLKTHLFAYVSVSLTVR